MFANTIRYFLLSVFVIFLSGKITAQQDDRLIQEVEVVKSYRPTISDANKISTMPAMNEEQHEKPVFTYSIFSQPIFNAFSVNTLKAATVASAPKEDPGLGYLRAGAGNYNRPYGELFFNSKNSRNTLFGLHGRHLSSHGKLNLEGGDRVSAPFSENEAEMFFKYFSQASVLSLNAGVDHKGFNYYGYPVGAVPESLLEKDQLINYFGSRQTFTKGSFSIGLQNPAARKNDFTFDFNFLYHYFGTKTGQREHLGKFLVDLKKPFYTGTGLLEAGISYMSVSDVATKYLLSFGRDQIESGLNQQTWITAKPSYMLGGEVANISLGVSTWFVIDSSTDLKIRLAPNIRANLIPVKEIITIFAGIDGNFIQNHYSKIAYENPFVNPEHLVKNTFEQFRFFGGFDGKLAPKTKFKLGVNYSVVKDQPLYYLFRHSFDEGLAGTGIADNDFNIIYDNLNLLKFNLEIFHASLGKANLLLSGNYYVYNMETMEEAWNLPDWDAKLSVGYQISDQLSFTTDLFFTGQRQALIMGIPGENDPRPLTNSELLLHEKLEKESYSLSTVFDLNFNATYKITNQFSVFARLNNFGFQQYQRWLGYPVQSFNVLGGVGYSF